MQNKCQNTPLALHQITTQQKSTNYISNPTRHYHMLLPCVTSQELPPINNSRLISPWSSPAIYKTYKCITQRPIG